MKLVQTMMFLTDDSPELKYPQMWRCIRCGRIRQWGLGPSQAPKERPYLLCSCQDRHVTHTFAGLKAEEA